ncbi:MAG: SRPBCC domain-containing protein [Alphaproteobacteria bacterium]
MAGESARAGAAPGADNEIVITRLLRAPRALVWRAWTDPAQLPLWWGPQGFRCETAEIDIRVGGSWRFRMIAPDGTIYPNRVVWQEIVPPERLVYTIDDDGGDFEPFQAVTTFAEEGAGTRVTMHTVFSSAARRADLAARGAIEGGESTIDCLEAHLAAIASNG